MKSYQYLFVSTQYQLIKCSIFFSTGHCRKGTKGSRWRFGQEEIFSSFRFNCWTILFLDQKKNSLETRGCFVFLRQ